MLVFCLAASAVVFILARQLMGIFIAPEETEIIKIGAGYLRIEGACYCGIGILFLLYGYFRAVEKPKAEGFTAPDDHIARDESRVGLRFCSCLWCGSDLVGNPHRMGAGGRDRGGAFKSGFAGEPTDWLNVRKPSV